MNDYYLTINASDGRIVSIQNGQQTIKRHENVGDFHEASQGNAPGCIPWNFPIGRKMERSLTFFRTLKSNSECELVSD